MTKTKEVVRRGTVEVATATQHGVEIIKTRMALVRRAQRECMEVGIHYGKIPGTGGKPCLLQPGADILAAMFNLRAEYVIVREELKDDFWEYLIECRLYDLENRLVANALGSANSKEKARRNQGAWDTRNTGLKIAQKRARVAAVRQATCASEIFTEDVEDDDDRPRERPLRRPPPRRAPPSGERDYKAPPQRGRRKPEPEPEPEPGGNTLSGPITQEQYAEILEKYEWLRERDACQPIDLDELEGWPVERGLVWLAKAESKIRELEGKGESAPF